jgi:1D-myo-inositol 3-kinase
MLDYLAIGHLTVDRLATGIAPGGSVTYAGIAATRLGLKAGILTSADEELNWPDFLPGIQIVRTPSPATTSFENSYTAGRRKQRLLAVADPISGASVPEAWRSTPIVHVAPVAHEVGAVVPGLFPSSLIGLTPQGLLRRWGTEGVVRQGRCTGDQRLLDICQAVIFSEDDLEADPFFLARCRKRVPLVLLTRGPGGAILYRGDDGELFPAFRVEEVDPTGAGDVFAAAFLIEYNLTGDPRHSTAFACCAASFVVEQAGIAGIPDRAAVEHRLAVYTHHSGLGVDSRGHQSEGWGG